MRRLALILAALPFAALADAAPLLGAEAETRTNIVSNVATVRQWSRQYVFVDGAGELHDPSGRLVAYADEVGRQNRAEDVRLVIQGAHDGMTNALQRVYDLTNRVPERGVALRFSMKPSAERRNFFAYIVDEETDGTNDVARYYFSHVLDVSPKIQRRYRSADSSVFVEGEWLDYSTNGVSVMDAQGIVWNGCNAIRFTRPQWAVGYPVRPNRHCTIGHPVSGLDFAGAMVFVDGRPTLTGYVTNGLQRIYFDNGVYKGTEVIEE